MNELALFAGAEFLPSNWRSSTYAREKAKAWRLANPDKVKAHREKSRSRNYRVDVARKYGVSVYWFDQQFKKQNGKCDACGKILSGENKQTKPHVDHCHKTGTVRAILCNRCNSTLGLCEDNPDLLSKLADYLKCHGITAKH